MSYQQFLTPNLDPYINQPNGHGGTYVLTDWYGWCLAYVQTAFGTGWAGSNAWESWNDHTSIKHYDRAIPANMYVPIWFSGYGGLGHVAIYKDGTIWSSPWHHKPTADVLNSIEEIERIYGVTYAGWSEDLAGSRIVESVDPPPPPPEPAPAPVVVPEPTPEPLPSPPPVPYVPPAAPVKGTLAKKYKVLTTIMQFDKAQDAIFHNNAKGTVQPGDYYQFEAQDVALQLGTSNMTALYWVNDKDNVAAVVPPDVTPAPLVDDVTWRNVKYFPDGKSHKYVAQADLHITDYAAVDPVGMNLQAGETLPIWGYFTKDGITYLMPVLNDEQSQPINERRYGIPASSVYTGLPNMKSQTYIDSLKQAEAEHRIYRKSVHHETTSDKVYYAEQVIGRFVKDGGRFLDGIISGATIKKIIALLPGQKDKKQ